MNKILLRLVFIVSAFLAVWVETGQAQQSKSRPVIRLQPGMSWHVELLGPSDRLLASANTRVPNATPGALAETNTLGRDHRRQEVLKPGGKAEIRYITSEYLLIEQTDGTFALETTERDEELNLPRLRPDRLSEFAWTEGLQPVASVLVDGVDCDVFAIGADRNPILPANFPDSEIRYLAAIGSEDRFPRRLETPTEVLRFVPLPRVQPVGLPASAQRAVEEYVEKVRIQIQRHALPR